MYNKQTTTDNIVACGTLTKFVNDKINIEQTNILKYKLENKYVFRISSTQQIKQSREGLFLPF